MEVSLENADHPCPVQLDNIKMPPLLLDCLAQNDPLEMIKERIEAAVNSYRKIHQSSPQLIFCPGAAMITVHQNRDCLKDIPLRNKVALVTGSAGAIGAGISEALVKQGCLVAASDLPGERLDLLAEQINSKAPGKAMAVPMDVTDQQAVNNAFKQVILKWGGLDIVIINAGIAMVAGLTETALSDFRKLEYVNIEGTLLTLSEAGKLLRLQGTGGDIVLISTKNVFSPGAHFGAYSATKAAAHQLCRIASQEFAGDQIRVNMVAPDAVFSYGDWKSGLWQQIGPERMRHRGLDEKELEEYYRQRNLLKAKITAQHVANAVLFFVTRQTPTTGATIPVDGGLPDATPR